MVRVRYKTQLYTYNVLVNCNNFLEAIELSSHVSSETSSVFLH